MLHYLQSSNITIKRMEDICFGLVRKLLEEGPYKAERKLSEGTSGEVFEVTHSKSQQRFALKLIDLSLLNKHNKKHELASEIALLKRLNHPGIVKPVDVLRWSEHVGLVMELGVYGDLFSFINLAHSSIELQSRLIEFMRFYLAQALSAIDYLHSQGVVHRDIKPENFIIGADRRLRLIDFGTAFIAPQSPLFSPQEILELTCPESQFSESLVGSANYLSPESLQLKYTTKSDIWAFGILAYKFFYNSLPFQGSNNVEVFKQLTEADIEIEKANPALEELIVMCLKRDPSERPTAKMLQLCSLFKEVEFKSLFAQEPPISKQEIEERMGINSELQLDIILEKRMLLGNFKARFLTLSSKQKNLVMCYGYVPSRKVKRSCPLGINDFAQHLEGRVFEVVLKDSKYTFRVSEGQSASETVCKINKIIKRHFHLE